MSEEELKELHEYNLEYLEAQASEEMFGGDFTSAVELKQAKKEIERLNNRVKQLEKSIMISNKKHSFMTKDNIKLRTIINELEKDLEEKIDEDRLNILSNSHWKYVLDKLQELKGDDK